MDKLGKLKLEMLEARELYQQFLEDHKRPMTAEERLEHDKSLFTNTEGETLGEQVSGPETFVVELKTPEEAKRLKCLDEKMDATYRAFVEAYKKKDWSHE